jgi:hypothetical protein
MNLNSPSLAKKFLGLPASERRNEVVVGVEMKWKLRELSILATK